MALLEKVRITKDLRVGIGALLTKGGHNFDEGVVVLHSLNGPACFLLFLLFDHLGSHVSYFSRVGQGTMNFYLQACSQLLPE